MADETRWRNRIVGSGTKPADQFTHHPNNPKYHPPEQREALQGALNEIGWLLPVVENIQTGYLIDGHERVWGALQNNEDVPYIQVSLSPEEEAYALATLDPIGMMARHDTAKLDELLREVNSGEAGVQAMLAALAEQNITALSFHQGESGLTPDEKLDMFLSATIKQIVLYFQNDEYDVIVARLAAVRERENVDNNTDAVVRLLDHYENVTRTKA